MLNIQYAVDILQSSFQISTSNPIKSKHSSCIDFTSQDLRPLSNVQWLMKMLLPAELIFPMHLIIIFRQLVKKLAKMFVQLKCCQSVMHSRQHLSLNSLKVTMPTVCALLKKLSVHKCSGVDQIPTIVLKDAAEVISSPLYFIFNSWYF